MLMQYFGNRNNLYIFFCFLSYCRIAISLNDQNDIRMNKDPYNFHTNYQKPLVFIFNYFKIQMSLDRLNDRHTYKQGNEYKN
jgi:hypothetical protein